MAASVILSGCALFDSGEGIDPIAAQEQFCADVESHVEAIGRYGGLFDDVELTVGDVKSAQEELEPSFEAVEDSGAQFRDAVETDPSSSISIDLVAPETLAAVEDAEAAFAQASDIDDRTPVIEAGVAFSSAAYQLEVAWVRLFLDAGCLEGDAQAEAEAQQWVSDYVSAIQTDLQTIGYYDGEIDGIYGPLTIEAVEGFQEDNGLPVTGLVDPPTQGALQAALGDRTSAQVGALQAIMIATGHYTGPVDGIWSPTVESALIELQEDLGVAATGEIDATTLRALENALAASGEEPTIPSTVPATPGSTAPSGETTTTETATTSTVDTTTTVPASGGNTLDVLAETGQFEQFLAAVDAAGLTETLSAPGPFTIFAPTDEAFAATTLPEGQEALEQLILYHVVDGALNGFDVQAATSLATLQGADIAITSDQGLVILNGVATVTMSNIDSSNGLAHVINAVLLPPG